MKTIDDLHSEWEKDSIIDSTNLSTEALKTPNLHSKYLRILTDTKLITRRVESSLIELKNTKTRYYRGEMTKEELDSKGWSQYQGLKPMKSDMDTVLSCDPDVVKVQEKLDYYKIFVSAVEYILKEINNRNWNIRAAIDHTKMVNGLN